MSTFDIIWILFMLFVALLVLINEITSKNKLKFGIRYVKLNDENDKNEFFKLRKLFSSLCVVDLILVSAVGFIPQPYDGYARVLTVLILIAITYFNWKIKNIIEFL